MNNEKLRVARWEKAACGGEGGRCESEWWVRREGWEGGVWQRVRVGNGM